MTLFGNRVFADVVKNLEIQSSYKRRGRHRATKERAVKMETEIGVMETETGVC